MGSEERRRSCDIHMSGIMDSCKKQVNVAESQAKSIHRLALDGNKTATLLEEYVKRIDACSTQSSNNAKILEGVKLKQKITTWVAGTTCAIIISGCAKYIFKHVGH